MKDTIVVALLVVAFAAFATTHVAIAFGLAQRQPRWRALAAFAVPPLAPYWAWREQMRMRVRIWVGALATYVIALVLAYA